MELALVSTRSVFVQGLADEAGRALREVGVDESTSRRLIAALLRGVRHRFGGLSMYVPRGRTSGEAQAALALRLQRQGLSAAVIAERLGVTERRAYQLIKHGRQRLTAGSNQEGSS